MELQIFQKEAGQYLASSLGTPLLQGLTEVVQTRPRDPVTYLATYLYNFANKSKPNSVNQRQNFLIINENAQENFDLDNENLNGSDDDDDDDDDGIDDQDRYLNSRLSQVPIESAFNTTNRDEHGQSILHFSAVRSHPKDNLFHMLQERQINIGLRDELYRTARDIAEESNFLDNINEIDRFVVYLAARGETEKLVELLLEGYDHILDAEDDGVNITDIAAERNREATVQFLQSIPNYVTQREELHRAIRKKKLDLVKEILSKYGGGGTLLAVGKNSLERCSLHIAVLAECEDIVRFIAKNYPETLLMGDNLERTALHYAMGVLSVENLSKILIKCGAKRVQKDLKSRQPSYYFMNKSDIQRLQDEEQNI